MPSPVPPGPPAVTYHPLSLFGQLRRMRRDPLSRVRERFERYGDVYRVRVLGRDRLVLRHPAHLQQVLVERASCFEKPSEGPAARQLRRFLGLGLLTSNGELWRTQRRLIQPAFRKDRLEAYAVSITRQAEHMVERFEDGHTIDVGREMMELTLRIVCETLFGHELEGEADRFAASMRVFRHAFRSWGAVLPSYLPLPGSSRVTRALADIDAIVYELMDGPLAPERTDLLATLVAATQGPGADGMSRTQLRDELLTLFVAGHETTAHALSWTLHLLAQHPDVEAKLHAEVDAALADRAPRWSDLPKLTYTEQVLSEAMRLYPPAYVILRMCTADTELAGYRVPRGTDIVLWIYHAHHDARWFPEPERFVPERFSAAGRRSIPDGAYLPFGAGSRTCIGKQFALMEARLILASVIRRCSLRSLGADLPEADAALTLAPSALPLQVVKRSGFTGLLRSPSRSLR